MISYLVRRVLYAIPILIGVNLLTFLLFFIVNSPDDMARMQLGQKRVSEEAVLKWKQERGYDKPSFFDTGAVSCDAHSRAALFWASARQAASSLVRTNAASTHKVEKPQFFNSCEIYLVRVPIHKLPHRIVRNPVAVATLGLGAIGASTCRTQHLAPYPQPHLV